MPRSNTKKNVSAKKPHNGIIKRKHKRVPPSDNEEEVSDRIAQLEAKLATYQAPKVSKKKATKDSETQDDWQKEIKRIFSEDLWNGGNVKILWKDNQIRSLQETVFDKMAPHLKQHFRDVDHFIVSYGDDVPSSLNGLRQYCQQNVKKVADEFMRKDPNNKLPTQEEMEKLISRNFKASDARMMDLYEWYWDTLLPQVVGNTFDWHIRNRCFSHLSSARHGDDIDDNEASDDGENPPPYLVTPSTEVMAYLFIDNHRAAWEHQISKKLANAHYNGKDKDKEMPEAKWTINTCGRKKIGGWLPKARKEFKRLKALNHAGRAKATTEGLDAALLKKLKAAKGITVATAAEMGAKKRKRKKEEEEEEELTASDLEDMYGE